MAGGSAAVLAGCGTAGSAPVSSPTGGCGRRRKHQHHRPAREDRHVRQAGHQGGDHTDAVGIAAGRRGPQRGPSPPPCTTHRGWRCATASWDRCFPLALDLPHEIASQDFTANVESVRALNPDVVIQWSDAQLIEPLEKAGLKVIGLANTGKQEDVDAG